MKKLKDLKNVGKATLFEFLQRGETETRRQRELFKSPRLSVSASPR